MIKATNDNVLVIKDKAETEKNGLYIPDRAQTPVHRGKIYSAGKLVSDPSIKEGRTAIFNKSAGWEMPEGDVVFLVLKQHDVVSTDD